MLSHGQYEHQAANNYKIRMNDLRNHKRLRRKNRDGTDVEFLVGCAQIAQRLIYCDL